MLKVEQNKTEAWTDILAAADVRFDVLTKCTINDAFVIDKNCQLCIPVK
jgi:hypothetical protein